MGHLYDEDGELVGNMVRNNNCPASCKHYKNDTGLEDEYFRESCALVVNGNFVVKCPLGIWTTTNFKDI
ncbi:hypothetical protein LCGC14_0986370 [marine sediment metagenome]|uniref:Uncharacterized protein n=1 Tax=marine sediment metagenome TaxID=412755 RepID=A0A0F9N752_9ZZZZ